MLRRNMDILRRVSLLSITKPDLDEITNDKDKPKDSYYLVSILFLFFGLLNMLPHSFFVTANDYWMYKFRDVVEDTVDLNNKTTLQTYFTSGSTVVQTLPSIVTMLLSTTYGHRFRLHSRLIVTLALTSAIFTVFTIFIKVNTDGWQVSFFVATLLGISLITGISNLYQVTSTDIVSRFPPIYMKTFLVGQGIASVFTAGLEVLSLALGSSTETSALFYFISGTVVIMGTLLLYLFAQRTDFYSYYMQIKIEDTKKKYSKEDIKSTFFQIWPSLAVLALIIFTLDLTHPCITALVVSDNYGHGYRWNDIYFVPVITFLFAEVCSLLGRLISTSIITKSNGPWIVTGVLLRMAILTPLTWLSNAQPRNNLPVVLPYDWQYILLILVSFVSTGYLLNTSMLSLPKLAEGKEDVAYMLYLSITGTCSGVLSLVSLLAVRIL